VRKRIVQTLLYIGSLKVGVDVLKVAHYYYYYYYYYFKVLIFDTRYLLESVYIYYYYIKRWVSWYNSAAVQ